MNVRFVAQPFDGEKNLVDFIEHATAGQFKNLQIAVAWAKRSGLGRVRDSIEGFRDAGGSLEMIVGVSEGGATKEGLQLALDLADKAFVFHDPRRTFHPKVYLATGESQQSLIVGSSNLTAGGLAWNYEASVWMDWEGAEPNDTVRDVQAWFTRLTGESGACRELTAELIEKMLDSRDLSIGSEAVARRVAHKNVDSPEDNDSTQVGSAKGLFKGVTARLRRLPKLSVKSQEPSRVRDIEVGVLGSSGTPEPGNDPVPSNEPVVLRRWYRQLDHSQAQQKRTLRTKLTGCLKLGQAGSNVNHTTYFYEEFFSGLPWSPVPKKEQQLEVAVEFPSWIDGHYMGVHLLRISHDPRRVANQANVPTWLHWGTLSEYLKATNYVGFYITLERLAGNKFNLVISRAPRGEYLN
ncbi:phospholipase D family protein [Nocardiopsis dassonvillei]|uniref:phospholipase D family protein n=1 Tax=Nocardiopsis dassonvillei TaxID=2014 RepID=UPI003631D736